jgi:hypothetical protein
LATIGIFFPDAPEDAQENDGPPRRGENDYVTGPKHLMKLYPNHQKLEAHLQRIDDEFRSSGNDSPFERTHAKSTSTVKKKFSLKDQFREFVKGEQSRGVRFFQAKKENNDTVHHRTHELDHERAVHLLYLSKPRSKKANRNGGWKVE